MSHTTAHTGHKKKHLPETYLRLGGQGLKLAGQGKGLMKLANVAHRLVKSHHGKVGAAIIHAIGHVKHSKVKDKKKAFRKKLLEVLAKHHYPKHQLEALHGVVAGCKHRPIGIKDLFGKDHAAHGESLIASIRAGGNVFGDIGRTFKKGYHSLKHARDTAFHKLRDFAAGKTKFKPSQLANYLAGAVGIAGAASAFIPGVDLISVPAASAISLGLSSAGKVLKTSGRGLSIAGGGLPPKILSYVRKNPKAAKSVLAKFKRDIKGGGCSGSGKKVKALLATAGAIMLYGFLKDNAGNLANIGRAIGSAVTGAGLSIAGGGKGGCKCNPKMTGRGLAGITAKIKAYMREHPHVVKKMAKKVHAGESIGSGSTGRLTAALGLAGTSAAAGAYGMYHYLMANPSVAAKIAAKGVGSILGAYLKGGSLQAGMGVEQFSAVQNSYELPYGVSRLKSGKVKRDRYSVYHGYYNKTGSGLIKSDFALKGAKVVSKKRQAMGRKNMNFKRRSA